MKFGSGQQRAMIMHKICKFAMLTEKGGQKTLKLFMIESGPIHHMFEDNFFLLTENLSLFSILF